MSKHLTSMHRLDLQRLEDVDWLAARARTHHSKVGKPTPESPLIVSVSELAAFKRCRVKWWWGSQLRLQRTTGLENLYIGDLTHQIIDKWYRLGGLSQRSVSAMKRISRKMCKQYPIKELSIEDRKLVEAMCNGYSEWVLDPKNEDGDRGIGLDQSFPEEWFEVPLRKDRSILLRGRYDNRHIVLPRVAKKTLSGLETKTRGQFRDENLEQQIQCSGYLFAMWHDFPGYKDYRIWFQRLRKQLPGPRVSAPLFDRMEIKRTPEELEQWRMDAARTAIDMLDAAIYPSEMDSCSYACDFQGPCLQRGEPDDVLYQLKTNYKHREFK